ncbi:MAG: hypothetical protein ABIP94_24110 [Planctomycetota bacterium]
MGLFGAEPARLVPPEMPGELHLVLDAAALDGPRRQIGVFGPECGLCIARADQRAWLRVDGKLGPPNAGLRSRELKFEVTRHEQDGVYGNGVKMRLDPRGPSVEQCLQCGEAVILLDLRATDDGRVAVGARCFVDPRQEFEALQR